MRQSFILFLLVLVLLSCQNEQSLTLDRVYERFDQKMALIEKIEYDVENYINFSDGTIWDNPGTALLVPDDKDTIFGFSFYGIRKDVNMSSIYKDGTGFWVWIDDKEYRMENGSKHFLGSPGGQMIFKDFFQLDTSYLTANLTSSDSSYIIEYTYEDHPEGRFTEKRRIIEIEQTTFLPIRAYDTNLPEVGDRFVMQYSFSNYRINDDVTIDIDQKMSELSELKLKQWPQYLS